MYYVCVTKGLRGYFAVLVEEFPDGFMEPIQTGFGSYDTVEEAKVEAMVWAKAEDILFKE